MYICRFCAWLNPAKGMRFSSSVKHLYNLHLSAPSEITCRCFRIWQTLTFWREHHRLNDQNRGDFVYTCFKRSNTKCHIEHQKIFWSFWNLDQYLRLPMEYLSLYDNFAIASLQGMPQSDCLPVPALTGKPNDGEWWGVIGSVFVLSISEFKWILRFKIQVLSFYHLQPPQDADFELFTFVPTMFFVLLLFCKIRNKVQYDK